MLLSSPVTLRRAPTARRELTVDDYVRGLAAGDRTILGRAITLVESRRDDHQRAAQELLARVLPQTGKAHRVGITGVPGAGKSTLLESLGTLLIDRGHRLAVLAVDPSSTVSGGSILGDKTRMPGLSTAERAFIRPSPSGGSLGGVARKTREAMLLCEAAGFDVIFVETMGVGQSEAVVAGMVDFLLLLLLPGAGDELQGIKRGLLELVDMVAVNKADGENLPAARKARAYYLSALKFSHPRVELWQPPVVACSGLEGSGLEELWTKIEEHRQILSQSGDFERRRSERLRGWMWSAVEDELLSAFRRHPRVAALLDDLERRVVAGEIPARRAAQRLLAAFDEPRE